MNWNIPRTSGEQLSIPLNFGEQIFVVGANGSGKSALLQNLVSLKVNRPRIKWIAAHRQTWFDSGNITLTPHNRKEVDRSFQQYDVQPDARWKDYNPGQKQAVALFDLVANENDRARSIAHHVDNLNPKEALRVSSASAAPFAQVNELLALGTLTVSLENSKGEEILAQHGNGGGKFSIEKMSDGERSAVIMVAYVLTAEPATVFLIDEPERHLHRAIILPFLSALFKQREDCAFVISTHEIALPIDSPDARVLMVRSCTWSGLTARAWDVEVLEPDTELPEELKLAILGARERILFIEGTSSSLDLPLYNALFPGLSVVSKGSCIDVERAVTGLRESCDLHHVEAFGLIDKDDLSEEKTQELANKGVFSLGVGSVEALYYCSDAIEAVAHRQAESLGSKADEVIKLAKTKALDVLKQNGLAERMAARRSQRQLQDEMLSKLPSWKELVNANTDSDLVVRVDSSYPEELKRFKKLVADEKLDDLVARYPLRESQVFNKITEALECHSRSNYQRMVLARVRNNENLASKLKQRVNHLSRALEAAPMRPAVPASQTTN